MYAWRSARGASTGIRLRAACSRSTRDGTRIFIAWYFCYRTYLELAVELAQRIVILIHNYSRIHTVHLHRRTTKGDLHTLNRGYCDLNKLIVTGGHFDFSRFRFSNIALQELQKGYGCG